MTGRRAGSTMHRYTKYFPQRTPGDDLGVVSLMEHALRTRGGRIFLRFEDQEASFADIAQQISSIRAWLSGAGICPGDRVAVMLSNSRIHVALIYALILCGAVWVPVNTRLRESGLGYIMAHCRPELVVTEMQFADEVRRAANSEALPTPVHCIEAVKWPAASALEISSACADPSRPLCIIYTSGTTGAPKGVVFTHRMMRLAGEAALMVAAAGKGDCLFVWEPLCHIGGAQMLLTPFLVDLQLFVVERFSATRLWEQLAQAQATHLHYLGGILDVLMQSPVGPREGDHSLRVAWGAGVRPEAWNAIRERFGWRLRECYGMTECASFATMNDIDAPGSMGRPLPWMNVDLVEADGLVVAGAGVGEIVLSSLINGNFLPGYFDNPTATAQTLQNGKLHTGDMARRDAEGNYYFVGRNSDSMRVRGENVSAWEVEHVVERYPGVRAAAAVGVASDVGEQDILLYVQADAAPLDFADLALWASERLAAFQVPRYFCQVAGFERTPSERIRKHLLSRNPAGAWDRQKNARVDYKVLIPG